jgi:hypothetical protein
MRESRLSSRRSAPTAPARTSRYAATEGSATHSADGHRGPPGSEPVSSDGEGTWYGAAAALLRRARCVADPSVAAGGGAAAGLAWPLRRDDRRAAARLRSRSPRNVSEPNLSLSAEKQRRLTGTHGVHGGLRRAPRCHPDGAPPPHLLADRGTQRLRVPPHTPRIVPAARPDQSLSRPTARGPGTEQPRLSCVAHGVWRIPRSLQAAVRPRVRLGRSVGMTDP